MLLLLLWLLSLHILPYEPVNFFLSRDRFVKCVVDCFTSVYLLLLRKFSCSGSQIHVALLEDPGHVLCVYIVRHRPSFCRHRYLYSMLSFSVLVYRTYQTSHSFTPPVKEPCLYLDVNFRKRFIFSCCITSYFFSFVRGVACSARVSALRSKATSEPCQSDDQNRQTPLGSSIE